MTAEVKSYNYEEARERFLSLREVEHVTSLKKSTIYALVQSGEFPSKHPITHRRRAWLASEVQNWVNERAGHGGMRDGHLPQ